MRNADPGTEGTWTVLCGATVPVVPTALLERALEALQACSAPDKPTWAMAQRAQTLASDARAALDDPNTPEAECGFNESTDGLWVNRSTFAWTCPWCGTEHETEVDGT